MKKIFKIILLLLFIINFQSCEKNDFDVIKYDNNFDYTTVKNINIKLKLNDNFNGNYFYKYEIYDQLPLSNDTIVNLLSVGFSKNKLESNINVVVPTYVDKLFIKQISPDNKNTIKVINISDIKNYNVDFNTVYKTNVIQKQIKNDIYENSSDYALPENYTLLNGNKYNLNTGVYYIPSNITTNNINFNWVQNTSLYISGKVIFDKNLNTPPSTKIIVLPGGEVIFENNVLFEQNNIIIVLHNNSKMTLKSNGSLGGGAKIINDGILTINNFDIKHNSLFTNNGTTNINIIRLTNTSKFINNGNLKIVESFIMNSSTNLINNGVINGNEIITNNKTSIIENNNKIQTILFKMDNGGGQLFNNCSVISNTILLDGADVISNSGTLIGTNYLHSNNTNITLNGDAMFDINKKYIDGGLIKGAEFKSNVKINGNVINNNTPIFIIDNIIYKDTDKNILILNGIMELSILNKTPNSKYFEYIDTNVTITDKPNTPINQSSCNNGGVVINNNPPVNPNFPVLISEDNKYTYIMEDLWPHLGDYDMNDFVFEISNIKKLINEQNYILSLIFDIKPIAAGSTLYLSSALQFDDLNNSDVDIISTYKNSRKEDGQEKSNFILFENIHELFNINTKTIINTYNHTDKIESQTYTFTFKFNKPILNSQITIDKLNFYMIVGDINNNDRKEIHLANFKSSSKVLSNTFNYKDSNNMVWAIMLPIINFKYPTENTKIFDAYLDFNIWTQSNGEKNKTWYLKPNEKNVYIK